MSYDDKTGDYNQISNKNFQNVNESTGNSLLKVVIENMDCGEFLEKCGMREIRSSQSNGGNGQSGFKRNII